MAHQRLAARLLALQTQRLEDKLARVSDDCLTPSSSCHRDESDEAENKFSQRSEDCMTAYDIASMQESNNVEDKRSLVSNYFVTPTNVSYCDDYKELNAFDETETFSSSTCVDTVNSQLTRSDDAAGLVLSCSKLSSSKNAVIPGTGT